MIQEQFTALIDGATGAGSRIYPSIAPEGVISPFIVYSRVFSIPVVELDGGVPITNTRLQVDVYAESYAAAQTVAAQVAALLASSAIKNVPLQSQDAYESDVKLYRVSADFSLWH